MRQRRSGSERRVEIAKAVMALAAEHGIENLSVAQVARQVGITPPALYRHFPNKEAMLDATMEQLVEAVRDNLERANAGRSGALEALERFLESHVALVRGHRGMPYLMFSNSMRSNPRMRERFLALTKRIRSQVERWLSEGQRGGEVRTDLDPQTGALMFVGTFLPPAILWNLSDGRFDITAQVRRNWAFYRAAIASPRAAVPRRVRSSSRKETTS